MQIQFSSQSPRSRSISRPVQQPEQPLEKLEEAGDKFIRETHLDNAWAGARVALGGAAIGTLGATLSLASSSFDGFIGGAIIAAAGAATCAAGIYVSDKAFIAANQA